MINCGGGLKLTDTLSLAVNQVVYVIDSHRPYNVANILDDNHVCSLSLIGLI